MRTRRKRAVLLWISLYILTGCQNLSPTSSLAPSATPNLFLTATQLVQPTHIASQVSLTSTLVQPTYAATTVSSTSEIPPTQMPDLRSLLPGDYLIYLADDGVDAAGNFQSTLYAISAQSNYQAKILTGIIDYARVSPDNSKLAYTFSKNTLRILNFREGRDMAPTQCSGLMPYLTWSPDSKSLAISCQDNGYGIFILSIDQGILTPLIEAHIFRRRQESSHKLPDFILVSLGHPMEIG